ncbi:efflux RND transporter periplasmic adaptor subunit [Roseisolibacter sp. H3M3-2]|uniref:efflux RND transporter periplasmic adaptor subunit n=1 Tax=Roseisolibacter sp. H3M3-2 TaxID=3031323 RepID=UPI0023DA1E22|nr:efflux RND transporter periplasmic adaptor subunit [Roseisolibacter sp. H3M3-2]MDF1504730.1 efflux RND transporter periplasmic adaptor subunit [Roseisolibacter sp. H3M3-2]
MLGLSVLLAACGEQGANAAPAKGGPGGGPGGAGAQGGPGGRGRPPLVLAAADVGEVKRGSIEAGIPLSGDLRPLQTVVVRARIEGNLTGVYARPGQSVSQGQLLAQFQPNIQAGDRESAAADRASAQTEVSTAQWNLEQTRELFRAGAVAEREVRVGEQALAAARARLAAAEARVRTTGESLADTRVVAPLSGVVESRAVEGNERVTRGAELFTIVRGDRLELAASVPERLSSALRAGQSVRLSADGRTIEGRVARVSPTIDPATRAVTVFVEVPNPGGALRGNTFVTGRAVGRTINDAVLVPTTALRQAQEQVGAGRGEGSNTFVYRLRGQTAERAPVNLGLVDEAAGIAEVVEGLQPGDRVIVGNVAGVGQGTTVQILGGERPGGNGRQAAAGPRAADSGTPRSTP